MNSLLKKLQFVFIGCIVYLVVLGISFGFLVDSNGFPVFVARILQVTAITAGLTVMAWPVLYILAAVWQKRFVWKKGFTIFAVIQLACSVAIVGFLAYEWFWPSCKYGVNYAVEGQATCSPNDFKGIILLPVLLPLISLVVWLIIRLFQAIFKFWSKRT